MIKKFTLILLVFTLGCKSAQVATDEMPVIFMSKSACMGTCPVYDISVYSNGRVLLNAKQFLKIEGSYAADLPKTELSALLNAFEQSNFTSYEKSYTSNMTDLPTTRLTYRGSGEAYTIVDYDGAPKSLKDLERRVHELVEKLDWKSIR